MYATEEWRKKWGKTVVLRSLHQFQVTQCFFKETQIRNMRIERNDYKVTACDENQAGCSQE